MEERKGAVRGDDHVRHYRLQGKRVSRADVQNLLYYAMTTQLMIDS